MPSLRCSMDNNKNDEEILLNLDLLEEKRELAAIDEEKHKKKKWKNTITRRSEAQLRSSKTSCTEAMKPTRKKILESWVPNLKARTRSRKH
ncbi:hypothetical protein Tco_1336542 [Tanacetum coccineum]